MASRYCGRGAEDSLYRSLIAKNGLEDRVRIEPFTNNVNSYYVQAGVYVLASRWEGMPLVLMEAMAHGLPVIASNLPIVEELLGESRAAVLFENGNIAELAERMVGMATSTDLAERGRIAMDYAREFSINNIIKRVERDNRKMMEEEKWTLVIVPKTGFFKLDLGELWRYRDLLVMYIRRDIVTFYKQTILGPLWFILQPLFTVLMFMFVFGGIAGISTDGLPRPLFYMAGLLCWNYFAECMNRCSDTFNANQNVFGKVYFPRLIVPLSIVVSSLVKMGIQFILFLFIYLYCVLDGGATDVNSYSINEYACLFPLLVLMLAGLGLGFGLLISSLTTKYRDLRFLVTFGVQLWMYATPVIYPLSVMQQSHEKYMWLIIANPLTSIIETFKYGFLGEGIFSWWYLGYSFLFTVLIVVWGMITFNKVQRSFMDVI